MPILSAAQHPSNPLCDVFNSHYPYICSPIPAIEAPTTSCREDYPGKGLDRHCTSPQQKTRKKHVKKEMAVSCAQTRSLGGKSGSDGKRQQGGICNERWVVLNKDTFQEIFEKSIDELICLDEPQQDHNSVIAASEHGAGGGKTSNDDNNGMIIPIMEINKSGGGQEVKEGGDDLEQENEEQTAVPSSQISTTLAQISKGTGSSPLRDKNSSKSSVHRKTHRHSRKNRRNASSAATIAPTTTETQPTTTTATTLPGDSAKATNCTTSKGKSVGGSAGISPSSFILPQLSNNKGNKESLSTTSHRTATAVGGGVTTSPEDTDGCANNKKPACEEESLATTTTTKLLGLHPTTTANTNTITALSVENASLRNPRPMVCGGGDGAGFSAQWGGSTCSGEVSEVLENGRHKNQRGRPFNNKGEKREHRLGKTTCTTSSGSGNIPIITGGNNNQNNYNPTTGGSGGGHQIFPAEHVTTSSSSVVEEKENKNKNHHSQGFIEDGSLAIRHARKYGVIDERDRDQFTDSTVVGVITDIGGCVGSSSSGSSDSNLLIGALGQGDTSGACNYSVCYTGGDNGGGVVIQKTDQSSEESSGRPDYNSGEDNKVGDNKNKRQKQNNTAGCFSKENSCGNQEEGSAGESVTNQWGLFSSVINASNRSLNNLKHHPDNKGPTGQEDHSLLLKPSNIKEKLLVLHDYEGENEEISSSPTTTTSSPRSLQQVEAVLVADFAVPLDFSSSGRRTKHHPVVVVDGEGIQSAADFSTCMTEPKGGAGRVKNIIRSLVVPGDLGEKKEEGGNNKGQEGERSGEQLVGKTQVLLLGRGDQAAGIIQRCTSSGGIVGGGGCLQANEKLVDVVVTQQDLVVGPSFVGGVSSSQGLVSEDQSEVLSLTSHAYTHSGESVSTSSRSSSNSVGNGESQFSEERDNECGGVVSHGNKGVNNNNNDYNEDELRDTVISEHNAMSDSSMRVFSGNYKMNTRPLMSGPKMKVAKPDNINWISVNKADVVNLVNEIVFEGYGDSSSSGNEHGYSDDNTERQKAPYFQDTPSDNGLNVPDGQTVRRGESPHNARSRHKDDDDFPSDNQVSRYVMENKKHVVDTEHAKDQTKSSSHEDGPIDLSQPTEKSQHLCAPVFDPSSVSTKGLERSCFDPQTLTHPVHALLFGEGALKTKSQESGKGQTHQSPKSAAKLHHSKNSHNQVNSKQNVKQCWVALNKDLVMDIVDTAYDSIDKEFQANSPKSPLKNHMDNNEYVYVNEHGDIAIQKYGSENRPRQIHSQSDKDSDIDVETVDSDLNADENTYPSYGSNSAQMYKGALYGKFSEGEQYSIGLTYPPSRASSSKNDHKMTGKHYEQQVYISSRKRKRKEVSREGSASPSNQLVREFEDLTSSSPKRPCSPAESEVLRDPRKTENLEHGQHTQEYYRTPQTSSGETVVMSPHFEDVSSKISGCCGDDKVEATQQRESQSDKNKSLRDERMLYSLMLDKTLQSKYTVPGIDQHGAIRTGQSDIPQNTDLTATPSQSTQDPSNIMANVASAPGNICANDSVPLRSPSKATEVAQQRNYSGERESQSSPVSKGEVTGIKTSRDSPKLGWVAVSKEEVHTIVASVMNEMISTDVCSPRDNLCGSPRSQKSEGSPRSITVTQHAQLPYPSPGRQEREGHTPSPSSLSTNSGPQEDANLPDDETRSIEGSAHTPNSTSSSRGFKWKTSLLKRAREEDEEHLSSDSVSDQSHDGMMSHNIESHDQSTSHRRSRRSKRKT